MENLSESMMLQQSAADFAKWKYHFHFRNGITVTLKLSSS